jgi:hypothetical protein
MDQRQRIVPEQAREDGDVPWGDVTDFGFIHHDGAVGFMDGTPS